MPGMNENFQPNHFVPLVYFVANDGNQKKNKQQKITDMFKAKSVKQESNQNIISEGMYFNNNNHNNNNNNTTTTTVYFKITIWLFVHLYALKIEQC